MKKIRWNAGKLQLNKATITTLTQQQMIQLNGGLTTIVPLPSETCPSQYYNCPQPVPPLSPVASLVVNSCTTH